MIDCQEQTPNSFIRDALQEPVVARCQDAGGHPADDLLIGVECEFSQLASKHSGFRFRVTETLVHGIRNATMIVADLAKSSLMVVPIAIGVPMLAPKSFGAGVIALLPTILSIAALAAIMVVCRLLITSTGAAVFVLCFRIDVDDTIHANTAFNR